MDELFDESHYFVCSGGLKPASMKKNQNIVQREDGKYYLTEYSLKCYSIDFSCKWVALLYAIVAAAVALLLACPAGWVLLAAIIGAGVGAALGASLCGDMAAIMRVWVAVKTDLRFGEHNAVANRPGVHMTCSAFSGQITYVPNVNSEFHALVLFAGNTLMTGLEGFMYVYAFRGAGMLITKPLQFFANFGVNYLKSVSVAGFAGRTVFGAWSGFSSYSNSATEGFHAKEVFTDAGKSFGFAEVAAYNAVTERDPQSIALLLSMGGIPGGINNKDANGLANVKAEAKVTGEGWKNAGEKVADQLSKTINAAKELRERLTSQKKGIGAHEKSAEQVKAEELINNLKEIEPEVTTLLSDLAKRNDGKMVGLDFRLKSEESLSRKLKNDGLEVPMNDVLRYTTIFEEGRLTSGTKNMMDVLKEKGYETIKVKNTFKDGVVYKGINTNVKAPNGQVFELQYHTPESFNIKQNINHALYEKARVLDMNSNEYRILIEEMKSNSGSIINPPNVGDIK